MTSNIELERQAMALLADSFDVAPEERDAFIRARAGQDYDLAKRALELLAHDLDEARVAKTGGGLASAEEPPPERIGPYRLTRKIGEGGMGAVYLGERVQGNFEQFVAIKLVRNRLSAKLSDRLMQERKTLARLRHPNIAQLYDGGEFDDGAPYFIMEYVEGRKLNDYLAETESSIETRLSIFADILSAVAYAHRNLVIHRDLSPSNALISDDGVVKLIDFGISHTLDAAGASGSGLRRTMTRGYAAPEQMRGEATTTLSDVYSLGKILRDLVAGLNPPRQADLAAIQARACADNAELRYQSVEAFSADVVRYRAGKPVEASHGGTLYRTARFIGRHPLSVVGSSLAIVSLIAAVLIMTWLFLKSERAEAATQRRFDEVRELANVILFDLHDEIAAVSGSTRARVKLVETAQKYLTALNESENAPRSLRLETAIGFHRLGDVTGNPINANLGRRAEADEILLKAHTMLVGLVEEDPDDPAARRALASAALSLAFFNFIALDDNQAAADRSVEAASHYQALIDSGDATLDDQLDQVEAISEEGVALVWMAQGEKSMERFKAASDLMTALVAQHPANADVKRRAARLAIEYGDSMARYFDQTEQINYEAPLAHIERGLEAYREISSEGGGDNSLERATIIALFKVSLIYGDNRQTEAVAALREAEEIADRLIQIDPNDFEMKRRRLSIIQQMAQSLAYLGRLDEAMAKSQEDIAGRRALLAREPENGGYWRELAAAHAMYAEVARLAGDMTTACANYRDSKAQYGAYRAEFDVQAETLRVEMREVDDGVARCAD